MTAFLHCGFIHRPSDTYKDASPFELALRLFESRPHRSHVAGITANRFQRQLTLSTEICLQWKPRRKLDQFSSVHDGICALGKAHKNHYALQPVFEKFSERCLWNGSEVRLIDNGRGLSRPLKEHLAELRLSLSVWIYCAYSLSLSFCSRRSMVWCTWKVCVCGLCLDCPSLRPLVWNIPFHISLSGIPL